MEDLFYFLSSVLDIPHTGWLPTVVSAPGQNSEEFHVDLAFEGIDGPLRIRFADKTELAGAVQSASRDPWAIAIENHRVQELLEQVVTLAEAAELVSTIEKDNSEEGKIAEAVLQLLAQFSTTEEPPRRIIGESLRWIGGKVDTFIDAAMKVGGTAAGLYGTYLLGQHLPGMAQALHELRSLAGD